jgi:hypothetical protein
LLVILSGGDTMQNDWSIGFPKIKETIDLNEELENNRPYPSFDDDGALILEWILDDARFVLFIEPDQEQSGWCYVNKQGTMESGKLSTILRSIDVLCK